MVVNTAVIFISTFSGLKTGKVYFSVVIIEQVGKEESLAEKRAPINSLQRSGVGNIPYGIPFNYQKVIQ